MEAACLARAGVLRSRSRLMHGARVSSSTVFDGVYSRHATASRSLSTDSPARAATPAVRFEDIARAHSLIRSGIVHTVTAQSFFLSDLTGMDIHVKEEFKQKTGSFKERGARNALLQRSDVGPAGVIAASAGNHALALAWHGHELGIPVTVIMPTLAPLTKVQRCIRLGATVVQFGSNIGEAKLEAQKNPEYADMAYINGYDDPEIIAGAGSIGVEIVDQMGSRKLDAVVVPIGGGGLIAGIGLAIKTLLPHVEVIGVEPELCPSFTHALQRGSAEAIPNPSSHTLADGLNVPCVGSTAFEVAREVVDDVVTVSEGLIARAVLHLVESEKSVVEGGGAAGIAALLPGGPLHKRLQGKHVVVPLCGGNIDSPVLGRVIERGLAAEGRLSRFVAVVSDRPGGVAGLAAVLATEGASLKDIVHERAWLHSAVDMVECKCVIETTGWEHQARIRAALEDAGYSLQWGPMYDKLYE